MVFGVVALALIVKRVIKPTGTWAENAKPAAFISLLTGCCIGERQLHIGVVVQRPSVLAASTAPDGAGSGCLLHLCTLSAAGRALGIPQVAASAESCACCLSLACCVLLQPLPASTV
jgi:hypothetical protein